MKSSILGIAIDNCSFHEAQRKVRIFLEDGKQHYIVTPNPEFLLLAQKDREFYKILNTADLSLPDGVGLIFASHFLRQPLAERITGVSFVHALCDEAERAHRSIFLLGSTDRILKIAGDRLRKEYPQLHVAGMKGGGVVSRIAKGQWRYEDTTILDTIRKTKPDILFVALGQGKQEKWIADHLAELPTVKVAMGVGGALDYIAGAASWAPKWVRGVGLEWLWRLAHEPRRWRRILNAVILFPIIVLYERFFREK